MSVLVLGEHREGVLNSAMPHVVAAARQLSEDVDVLIVGFDVNLALGDAATLDGVRRVMAADSVHLVHPMAEDVTNVILPLMENYTHLLVANSAMGRSVLPRVAALLDVSPISDVIAIKEATTFVRPAYAGSVLETVRSKDAKQLLSIRPTAFEPVDRLPRMNARFEVAATAEPSSQVQFVSEDFDENDGPTLSNARVVISGGRGVGSADNFLLLAALADKLNAAIGASRAAVDAGFVPNDLQVGQTGKIVAPELYIAIGISGAIQHLAGMQDSKVIVAINQDPEAPIFRIADYGLVGDLLEVLPELERKL